MEIKKLSSEAKYLKIFNIEDDLKCIRCLSKKRLRFEIEYALERGTSVNSFLIGKNNNEILLIHPPGENYKSIFLKEIHDQINPTIENISIIVGHINPNRVSLLREFSETYRNITLICTQPGVKLLKDIWAQKNSINIEKDKKEIALPKIKIIKKTEIIHWNDKYQLHLIPIPTARWPGGLIVFEESLGLLMSDKLFGAHISTESWAEINSISTEEERRHYFDCLMASMTTQIQIIIDQLNELDIKSIAPGHGPAIEGSWRSLLNNYERWGDAQQNNLVKIVLLYASAYGNTAAIADALTRGINKTGVTVESINCEFTDPKTLINSIKQANGYLIGSPTLGGHAPTPIISALGILISEGNKKNPIGIFGSYGWSGEAIDFLENKLKDAGYKFGFSPLKVKFSPSSSMVKTIEETGSLYGKKILKQNKQTKRRAGGGLNTSTSEPYVLALGRIVGSLCILATRKGEGENELNGAMVASWVSQASFSPPGITIAIAKERAMENLLYKGDNFTLNILKEGEQHSLLRQFLQSFAPGTNRLSGLEFEKSPKNQPIFPEAVAWLEGSVEQRMECGDHWLLYAKIQAGEVLDHNGITAVHHRRTGANY